MMPDLTFRFPFLIVIRYSETKKQQRLSTLLLCAPMATDPLGPDGAEARAAAILMADTARAVLLRYFRTPLPVEYKVDGSAVSHADREAEASMRAIIVDRFPRHGIKGEEFGDNRAGAEYVWVLDPLDGTSAFLAGAPTFGCLIALVYRGRPVLGVIEHPATGERWVGVSGEAAVYSHHEHSQPVKTHHCETLGQATLSATTPEMFHEGEAESFARLRASVRTARYGLDCYAYGLLSLGYVDLVAEASLGTHDFCALAPVVTGAGGVITDWLGQPLTLGSDGRVLAAGAAALHAQALVALDASGLPEVEHDDEDGHDHEH